MSVDKGRGVRLGESASCPDVGAIVRICVCGGGEGHFLFPLSGSPILAFKAPVEVGASKP